MDIIESEERTGALILRHVATLLKVSRLEMLFEIAPDLQTALDSD